jgi:hypothetical protein
MAPIAIYGGEPADFTVANGGAGLILIAGDAHPKFIMPSTMRFVFVDPGAAEAPGNQSSRARFGGFGDRSCQSGEPVIGQFGCAIVAIASLRQLTC